MSHTLARRYLFKLGANIASVPVYLFMEAILPRALGPQAYGNYNFTTNLFQQFSGFLDMGTSTCFYNALSRNQSETSLFSFYLRIILLVFILMLACALVLLLPQTASLTMPDVPPWLAPLAAGWAFLTWLGRVLRSTNDALGLTVASEIWRASLSIAGVFGLAALFFAGLLNMASLFIQQYLLLGSLAAAFWFVSYRHWRNEGQRVRLHLSASRKRKYRKNFFDYSHPLFVQALLTFAMLGAERWLLQWFDGSSQQGYYALSQKVSMACFLFVSAMTPLLMREFSIAWGKGDLMSMGALLRRFAPILYVLAAYFSCFTVVEAASLVEFFGGREFAAAVLPVQIMALYPLHQVYGQIAGSIFHASGKTAILRNMAALECLYGLALAWFMLAPAHLGGLALGASGLAIKSVSTQFLTVNLYLWLASRFVPFSFWRNLLHQLIVLAVLLALALLAHAVAALLPEHWSAFARFFVSGTIYTLATVSAVLLIPGFSGLTGADFRELHARFTGWL